MFGTVQDQKIAGEPSRPFHGGEQPLFARRAEDAAGQFARRFESRQRQEAVGVGGGEVAGKYGLQRPAAGAVGQHFVQRRPGRPAGGLRRVGRRRRRPRAALAPQAVFREGGGEGRLAQLAHHLGDQLRDLNRGGSAVGFFGQEMNDAVGEFPGQEGVGPAERFGRGEQGPTDLVGVERLQAAVALPHPCGRRQGVVHDCGPPCKDKETRRQGERG